MLQISAILPFADDEDIIGTAVATVGANLASRGLTFEIICVDVDSRDNSHAVVALLREQWPQLRVIQATDLRGALEYAVLDARGKWVWMTPAARVNRSLPLLSRMWRMVHDQSASVAAERPDSLLARRVDILPHSSALRGGQFSASVRKLVKRAQNHRLTTVGAVASVPRKTLPIRLLGQRRNADN